MTVAAEKYVISEDPKDIRAGLAPEHYGDVESSCDGAGEADGGLLDKAKSVVGRTRAAFSSYPARPGSLGKYGTARERGWGSGWPNCSTNMVAVVGGGVKITVRREIAEIVRLLLNYAEDSLGYDIKSGQTGGYNCRCIAGTNVPSNHSWGLALDINWSSNPYTSRFTCNIPPKLVAAMWRCGFYWGGWYIGGRFDTMHFEYVGKPSSVATHLARARALGKPAVTAPIATTPVTTTPAADADWGTYYKGELGTRVMVEMDRGDDVKWVQSRLGLEEDGDFGPGTEKAVIAFQERNDLDGDGEVGPRTLAQLRKVQVSLKGLAAAYGAAGKGDADADTKQLQQRLNEYGFPCGTPDGYYGERTRDAMSAFRARKYNTYVGHPDTVGAPGKESLLDLGFSIIP